MPFRTHAAALVLVAAAGLTACAETPLTPAPPTPASPSAAAEIFQSDDEATDAADALVTAYWDATNTIFKAGGEGVEILEPLVTERRMESEARGAKAFHEQGFTQLGDHSVDGTAFQQMYERSGVSTLIVTTCVDYSSVRAVTDDGREAVRKNTEVRYLHQVTIHVTGNLESPDLRLDMTEPWPDSPC